MADKKPTFNVEALSKFEALEELEVEYVSLDELIPNEYNPNRQSEREFELLKESIRANGFTQPILAQRDGKRIVDGEHRWRAAREVGLTEVPVVFVNFSRAQMQLSTLRHNRARGGDDLESLQAMLRDMRTLGALDQASQTLGLNDDDLQALIGDLSVAEAFGDENGEFHRSWEPMPVSGEGQATEDIRREDRLVSASAQARDQEAALAQALASIKDDVVRKDTVKEHRRDTYELNMVFSGEEAVLLRNVLGVEQAATRFFEICQKSMEGQNGGH